MREAIQVGRPGKIYFLHLSQELVKKFPPRFQGKITPLPPPKMSFSSKKGHFKTHDGHFYKKNIFKLKKKIMCITGRFRIQGGSMSEYCWILMDIQAISCLVGIKEGS